MNAVYMLFNQVSRIGESNITYKKSSPFFPCQRATNRRACSAYLVIDVIDTKG